MEVPIRAIAVLTIAIIFACLLRGGDGEVVQVRRVIDGDTLELTDGRKVRLLQVNAPEKGQCGYLDAGAALRGLVLQSNEVVLEPDERFGNTDKYGRLLRYVHADGVNVNVELQRQGFVDTMFYEGKQGKYAYQMTGPGSCAS